MVKHNNEWGTVCDDGLYGEKKTRVAQSACYTLGFSGGSIETYNSVGPAGQIWMDEVDCASSTMNFLTCSHPGWGKDDCSHYEDVLLTCT